MRNPLTTESLISWLEKQPASEEYAYGDNSLCALCRYMTAAGFDVITMGSITWFSGGGDIHYLPSGWNNIVLVYPHTYGAALERARNSLVD